jgi:hypothetical protein
MRGRNMRRHAADGDARLALCRSEGRRGPVETTSLLGGLSSAARQSHGASRPDRDMTKPVDQLFFACDTVA